MIKIDNTLKNNDPICRLMTNVEDASVEESEEVLSAISKLNDSDLSTISTKRFKVKYTDR